MKEIEKLQAGEYYRMDDVEISEIQMRAIDLCQQINNLSIFENKKRDKLLRKLFGSAGKNLSIKPGFLCDLGINIHIGASDGSQWATANTRYSQTDNNRR